MERTADNLAQLRTLLQQAMHPDLREAAEQKLAQCEPLIGYLTCLHAVAVDSQNSPEFRLFALILLKNALLKRFRKRLNVSEEDQAERNHLKVLLLQEPTFAEPDNAAATQLGLCVVTVSSATWPKWRELFPTLMNILQSSHTLYIKRVLYIMHQCFKQLMIPHRLSVNKATLEEISNQLVGFIRGRWYQHTQQLFQAFQTAANSTNDTESRNAAMRQLLTSAETSLQYLKVLYHLVLGIQEVNATNIMNRISHHPSG